MVGQVSRANRASSTRLLGELRAPVDALPATDAVDLYECQPDGLPPLILRDTPGYGARPPRPIRSRLCERYSGSATCC